MIPTSLIKKLRLAELEELAQVTDSNNNDGVVHTFKLRTTHPSVHILPLFINTHRHRKIFLFPFAK